MSFLRNIKYFDGTLFFERDLFQFNHLIIAKKPVHFFNPFTARVNVGVAEVVLTFESVDKIL